MNDEGYYSRVAEELLHSMPIAGLWAKAFAECDGREPAAKALYLRLRVAQLIEIDRLAEQRLVDEANAERLKESEGAPPIVNMVLIIFGVVLVLVLVIAAFASLVNIGFSSR